MTNNRRSSIENSVPVADPKSKDFLFAHLQDLPYFRALLRSVESFYYQGLPLPEPIYDVGCGDGHFASVTFDKKLTVGLDPWHGPIHEAKKFNAYDSLVEADGLVELAEERAGVEQGELVEFVPFSEFGLIN